MARHHWLCLATVLMSFFVDCSTNDENDIDDVAPPATSSAPPIQRWENLTADKRDAYQAAAARILPALNDPALLGVGVEVCRGMFAMQTDDELIEIASREVVDRIGVKVRAADAGRLIPVTNDHVCPDLLR